MLDLPASPWVDQSSAIEPSHRGSIFIRAMLVVLCYSYRTKHVRPSSAILIDAYSLTRTLLPPPERKQSRLGYMPVLFTLHTIREPHRQIGTIAHPRLDACKSLKHRFPPVYKCEAEYTGAAAPSAGRE